MPENSPSTKSLHKSKRNFSHDWDANIKSLSPQYSSDEEENTQGLDSHDDHEETNAIQNEDDTNKKNNPPVTESKKKPVRDRYHVAYALFFLLGAGSICPSHAFLMSVDFFNQMFPTHVRILTFFNISGQIYRISFTIWKQRGSNHQYSIVAAYLQKTFRITS
jgi:hypothetical protein